MPTDSTYIYDLRWYPIATDALYTTQTGSDYIEYTLTLTDYNDNVIGTYEGRAYSKPDGTVNVYVNDIVANYLTSVEKFPFENNINIVKNYRIKATITTNFGDEQTFVFMNSWVREPSKVPSDSISVRTWWRYNLSTPIDDKFDPRQYLTFSWNEFALGDYYKIGNGSLIPITPTTYPMTVFFSKITTDKPVTFGSVNGGSFTYKPVCGDYALYYVNAYGGWDSLLVKAKQTDEIKSYDYSKTRDFEKGRYLNVITPTWNVTTYYGVNGNRMFHLLESTCVYLHNLETNEMTKVVIEDSKCEYKDRFTNYTFKLNACLDNYRK